MLRACAADILKLETFDDLVASFKDTVRRVSPRAALLEVFRVPARKPDTLRSLSSVAAGAAGAAGRRPSVNDLVAAQAPPGRCAPAVATPFGCGRVLGLKPGGRVEVRLDWGAVAALRSEDVLSTTIAPPPPVQASPPLVRVASNRSDSPDPMGFRARRDFLADY